MRYILASLALAGAAFAQTTQPIELVPQGKLDTFTVSHHSKAVAQVVKSPGFIQLSNPSFTSYSCMLIQSTAFPFAVALGNEPGRPRVRITTRAVETTTNVGFDTVWIEAKDAGTGARLAIFTGSTQDEITAFPVKVPNNPPNPITALDVLWTVKLPPRMTWRLTGLSANRTWGPSLQYVASKVQWWVSHAYDPLVSKIVSKSNYGGASFAVVLSATRYPNPVFAFGQGPGLLVAPDTILYHPTIPLIVGGNGITPQLIAALRLLHCQPLEIAPDATGWPITG